MAGAEVEEAFAPQSIVLHAEDNLDISRGDTIINSGAEPVLSSEAELMICWMDTRPLQIGGKYLLQHNSKTVRAVIKEVNYKLDINSLEKVQAPENVVFNDIISVKIKTASALVYDSYKNLPANGGAILIDETAHTTVAACMFQ